MIHGSLGLANSTRVIKNVRRTTNFLERMRGLLGAREPGQDEGLLIDPCSSIHTFGMFYPIDVLFLDRQLHIVKTVACLRPWRMAAARNAGLVLEMAAHSIENLQLRNGQQLEWMDESVE